MYGELPGTTAAILHPNASLKPPAVRKAPEPLSPPYFTNIPRRLLYTQSLGEYTIKSLLQQWLPTPLSIRVAAGWQHDQATVFRLSGGRFLVAWQSSWQTPVEARAFFDALLEGYGSRFRATLSTPGDRIAFAVPRYRLIALRREGNNVAVFYWPE